MKTLVIVPTYNERENIEGLAGEILKQGPAIDLLFVDDRSPDKTGELADRLAARNSRILVIHRLSKSGIGTAYLEGFRIALNKGYEAAVTMDADFSHDPAMIPKFIERLEEFDGVIGSRWVRGGEAKNWPLHRLLLSRFGSFYARSILGIPILDMTTGYQCFHRRLLSQLNLSEFQSDGYCFQIEIKARAVRQGFRLAEYPIVFSERRYGKSKLSKRIIFEAVWKVWQLKWRLANHR